MIINLPNGSTIELSKQNEFVFITGKVKGNVQTVVGEYKPAHNQAWMIASYTSAKMGVGPAPQASYITLDTSGLLTIQVEKEGTEFNFTEIYKL